MDTMMTALSVFVIGLIVVGAAVVLLHCIRDYCQKRWPPGRDR